MSFFAPKSSPVKAVCSQPSSNFIFRGCAFLPIKNQRTAGNRPPLQGWRFDGLPVRAALALITTLFAIHPLLAQPVKNGESVEPFRPNPSGAFTPHHAKAAGVKIDFSGVKSFSENALRTALADQIEEIAQSGLTPAAADDTAFFLGIFYRKNGFPDVEVKWNIAAGGKLALAVSEGPKIWLSDIRFSGNKAITAKVLADYVEGTTRERFPRLRQKLPYVQSDVETGVSRIQSLYESQGFLNVSVEPAKISFTAGKTAADISITIHEGTQYHFGKLNLDGDLVFYPQTGLLKKLKPFSEKPYTPDTVTNMQREIVYYYRVRGYYEAKVDASSDPAAAKDGIAPVTFLITAGNIYRFDGVNESGLDRLHPGFLKKRFAGLHGQFYNPEKLDDVYRSLMRTGLFKSLRITSKTLPTHEVELDMEAGEAKSKELGFLLGYGSYDGFLAGIQAAERDLFGTGRSLGGSAEYSQRLLKGEVQYLDPWFLESDNSLRLKLNALNQDFHGYSKIETGGRVELARALSKHLNISIFLLPREVHLTNIQINPASDTGPTRYFVNSLGTTMTLDLRDSAINPGKGFIITTTSDYAGNPLGSNLDFVRGTGRISYYLPIKRAILAFGARGGVLFPFQGAASIPIDERFFNGGGRSVRSFAEYELGPKDSSNNPIGGDTFTTFNAELDFPIIGNLVGATFLDAGSVGHSLSNGIGAMRYGIGGGLRYNLPVGPIRFDYGLNPDPRPGEKQGAFHLSFGFAF
jgi:outer membrane protein assembly complex protein YaeT